MQLPLVLINKVKKKKKKKWFGHSFANLNVFTQFQFAENGVDNSGIELRPQPENLKKK